MAEHLLTGAVLALWIELRQRSGGPPAELPALTRWWYARLTRSLGVCVQVEGRLAPQCLLVANHISWLDIPVLGALDNIGFLSKAEVRGWPLIGWMAALCGTRFIARGAHQINGIVEAMRQDLACGQWRLVFPEGTTSDGAQVLRFHARLFAIVQDSQFAVQPIALAYRRGTGPGPDLEIPYIGDQSLIANLWRVLQHPDLRVVVRFLAPIMPGDRSRRELAEAARSAIAQDLGLRPTALSAAGRRALIQLQAEVA